MQSQAHHQRYMPQLDALRGIAVLAVIVSHFGLGANWQWLAQSLDLGRLGVRLFFVLSGFLITYSLLEAQQKILMNGLSKQQALRQFYINRALRIFPIYYLVIAILWALDFQQFSEVGLESALYLANFDSVRYVGSPDQMQLAHASTAHFWSLAVEEQFYLLFPALVFFCKRRQLVWLIFLLISAAVAWRFYFVFLSDIGFPFRNMLTLPGCLDSLCIGAALSLYATRDRTRQRPNPALLHALLIGAGILFVVLSALYVANMAIRPYLVIYDSVIAILFAFLIYHASKSREDRIGAVLNLAPLKYLGKISYGVYIYHPFAPHLIIGFASVVELNHLMSPGVMIALSYALSFAAAAISWHAVEMPLLRLKKPISSGNLITQQAEEANELPRKPA